jgi:hypothetical protein
LSTPDSDPERRQRRPHIQDAELGTDDRRFALRAERSGNGPGRTYTAVYTATDESGNFTNALTTIVVPHDQGDAKSDKAAKAAKASAKAAGPGR